LIQNLGPSHDNDPASFGFTIDALLQINPCIAVTLKVIATDATVGSDSLSISATASGTVPPHDFDLNDGQSSSLSFPLTDVLDKSSITAAKDVSISVELQKLVGANTTSTHRIPFPYAHHDENFSVGGGKYAFTFALPSGGICVPSAKATPSNQASGNGAGGAGTTGNAGGAGTASETGPKDAGLPAGT
jgi:hypothetical protein